MRTTSVAITASALLVASLLAVAQVVRHGPASHAPHEEAVVGAARGAADTRGDSDDGTARWSACRAASPAQSIEVPAAVAVVEDSDADGKETGLLALETDQDQLRAEELLRKAREQESPYERFLRSPDAALLADEASRAWVAGLLHDFPLLLEDGEYVWLHDRLADGGWRSFGDCRMNAVIALLGYGRLMNELPPESAAELAEWSASGG